MRNNNVSNNNVILSRSPRISLFISLILLLLCSYTEAADVPMVIQQPLQWNEEFCGGVRSLISDLRALTSLPIEVKECVFKTRPKGFGWSYPGPSPVVFSINYEPCEDEFYKVVRLLNRYVMPPWDMRRVVEGLGLKLVAHFNDPELYGSAGGETYHETYHMIVGIPRCLVKKQRRDE